MWATFRKAPIKVSGRKADPAKRVKKPSAVSVHSPLHVFQHFWLGIPGRLQSKCNQSGVQVIYNLNQFESLCVFDCHSAGGGRGLWVSLQNKIK